MKAAAVSVALVVPLVERAAPSFMTKRRPNLLLRRAGAMSPGGLLRLLLVVLGVSLAVLLLAGCSRNPDVSSPIPTPKPVTLPDLIINPSNLPYTGKDGLPLYRYRDLTKLPDFHEGMQNPWLIEGSDLQKWNWQIRNRSLDLNKVTGILQVGLTDTTEKIAFSYDAIRFSKSEAQAALDRCAPGMRLDRARVQLTPAGRLELETSAEVDRQANLCRQANLDLESGEILSCRDQGCKIP